MKKILIRITILLTFFVGTVLIISIFLNNETTDNKMDMEEAKLPQLAIDVGEQQANRLYGYIREMQVDFMRDSLTPLDTDKTIHLSVKPYEHKIKSVAYEVRTSDGSKVVENAKIKNFTTADGEEKASFTIESPLLMNQEYSLRFKMETEEGVYYYYTRVIQRTGLNAEAYVEFVQNFYTKCLDKDLAKDLTAYLESDATMTNNSYTDVNIKSSWSQVSWGTLDPQLYRKGIPTIKDINETTGSVTIEYIITAKDTEGNDEYYQVFEFYRMRYMQSRVRLLNFERSVVEIFDAQNKFVAEDGICVGVTKKDIQYVGNQNGDIVAFVQAGDLWTYNRIAGKATKVMSFRDMEEKDERADYQAHDIKIIRVGETGDVDFVLYGYMNRGKHEGIVGTGVYHYNTDQNVLEEKFFLPSTVSYEFLKEDLESLSYVSTQNMLYLLLEGKLYQMNLEDRSYEILREGITKDCFVISDSHAYAAWMEEMDNFASSNITMIDFETAETRTITAADSTFIKAIGFINEDLVYGVANPGDILPDSQGNLQYVMHEIRIENFEGERIKEYRQDGVYIMDVNIQQGLLELVRAQWQETAYVQINSDHIMNNIKQEEKKIEVTTKATQRQGILVYLSFSQVNKVKNPLVTESKIMVTKENRTLDMIPESEKRNEYFVYAGGKLDGIYSNAGEAVNRADEQLGVVLNRAQQYVWERGNKKTKISIDVEDIPEIFKTGNLDINALQEGLGESASVVDLKGCTLDAVLYEVSCLRPVIAKISDTESVVIIGYDNYNTILYYPATGESDYYGMNDSTALFESMGNVFVSCVETIK